MITVIITIKIFQEIKHFSLISKVSKFFKLMITKLAVCENTGSVINRVAFSFPCIINLVSNCGLFPVR